MAVCYQCNSDGYYLWDTDDYGSGFLPCGAVWEKPTFVDGYIPRWTGEKWEQVENHVGEKGYVNGKPIVINEYGPYPEGWSKDAPPEDTKLIRLRKIDEELDDISTETLPLLRKIMGKTDVEENTEKLIIMQKAYEPLIVERQKLYDELFGPEDNIE